MIGTGENIPMTPLEVNDEFVNVLQSFLILQSLNLQESKFQDEGLEKPIILGQLDKHDIADTRLTLEVVDHYDKTFPNCTMDIAERLMG